MYCKNSQTVPISSRHQAVLLIYLSHSFAWIHRELVTRHNMEPSRQSPAFEHCRSTLTVCDEPVGSS
jgi:hypothetical protein